MIRICLTGKVSKKLGCGCSPVSTPSVKSSLTTLPLFGKYLSLNRLRLRITTDSVSCWIFPAIASDLSGHI